MTANEDSRNPSGELSGLFEESRRRYLLYCLYLYANPVRLPDIAYQITVWEADESTEDIATERYRTYMSLYHDHIPELVDADVIEYDQQEDMVALKISEGDITEDITRHLSREMDVLLNAEQELTSEEQPAAVPADLYRALAAPERRQLLSHLLREPRVTLDEAATVLAGWQATRDGPVGPDERERIRVALHHVHLPLLEDVGLVTYDRETEEIQRSSLTAPVRDAIQSAVRDHRMTRSVRPQQNGSSPRESDTTNGTN